MNTPKLPFCNQRTLHTEDTVILRTRRVWDEDGFERGQRRNGATQCGECGLWWPNIEEPDAWQENPETGKFDAVAWWGGVVCEQCDLLFVEQPDGRGEAYSLREQ
ncbi:MAG: hypothetical protein E6Q97_09730 [Desulfurellales bacterium]|nr:MAG: hypothetical protein E6Q97_09730 [Desulfurellales bacterium]